MSQDERFQDTGQYLSEFTDLILVVCPSCTNCANVIPASNGGDLPLWRLPRRLVCSSCSHLQEKAYTSVISRFGEDADPFFDQPLWLSVSCAEQVLWAFNAKHLAFLEDYVRATQREKFRDERGWRSTSLASSLPAWMIVAKHRNEVLNAIEKLKKRL